MDNQRSTIDIFGKSEPLQQDSLPEITADRIQAMISSGKLAPGTQLPNEIDLAEVMGVSRGTIRAALSLLQQKGLIWRRQGLGSFVSEYPILRNRLDINLGVTDLINSMNLQPGTRALEVEVIPADEHLAELLELQTGTSLVSIQRVRTADDKPVVASVDYIPQVLLEKINPPLPLPEIKQILSEELSLYRLLENSLGVTIEYGLARLRPFQMTALALKQTGLELPPGSVVLYLEQVDYDRNRQPITVSKEYHVPDFCEFTVYRHR